MSGIHKPGSQSVRPLRPVLARTGRRRRRLRRAAQPLQSDRSRNRRPQPHKRMRTACRKAKMRNAKRVVGEQDSHGKTPRHQDTTTRVIWRRGCPPETPENRHKDTQDTFCGVVPKKKRKKKKNNVFWHVEQNARDS